jgi:hypothetical protein
MALVSITELQRLAWCKAVYIILLVLLPLFAFLFLPRGFEPGWWWFLLALFVAGFVILGLWVPSVRLNLLVVLAFWSMFLVLEPQFVRRSIPFVASAAIIHGMVQGVIVLIVRMAGKH